MSERYEAEHRGPIFNFFWPFTRWLVTNLTAFLGVILFYVLNRTVVVGRDGVPEGRNILLLSNHQSMIDSWLLGICAYYPQSWWKPYLLPWNPAAEENFFDNPVLAWFSDQWKCIPVREGRRDYRALFRMTRALEDGVMILFPEGTRTRDGRIGRGRPGAGLVALATHPTVVPVTIDGMHRVLPVGAVLPRIGHRIHVRFGEPLEYDDLMDRPRDKETAQELVDRAMERLRHGLRQIREREGTGEAAAAGQGEESGPADRPGQE